jgi:hypothetical protein
MAKRKKKIDYSPLAENEWEEALNIFNTISDRIPENLASTVWYLHLKITGTKENQPCTCASSGKLWLKAVNNIREFVKKVNG